MSDRRDSRPDLPAAHQSRVVSTPTGIAPGYRMRRVKELPPQGQNGDVVYSEADRSICIWIDDEWICNSSAHSGCYTYVLDGDGGGTHTTLAELQAELATLPAGSEAVIFVCPGSYTGGFSTAGHTAEFYHFIGVGAEDNANGISIISGNVTLSGISLVTHWENIQFSLGTWTVTAASGHRWYRCVFTTTAVITLAASGCVFSECVFNASSSITGSGSPDTLRIESCAIHGVIDFGNTVSISHHTITNNRFFNPGRLIYGGGAGNIVISDNEFLTTAGYAVPAITIEDTSPIDGIIIDSNILPPLAGAATGIGVIEITATDHTQVVVSGNYFEYRNAQTDCYFIRSVSTAECTIAVVGNGFGARNNTPTWLEDDGGISISGKFIDSVFGPNFPSDFKLELLAGSANNLYNGVGTVIGSGVTTGAPANSPFLTVGNDAGLSAERAITPRFNLYGTDGGANAGYTLDSWLEGALITPAAGVLTLGVDGDVFHVAAGNFSSIATPTRQTIVVLVYDGASVLTHSANLILQGAANYSAVAGDISIFFWEGGTVWREINRHTAAAAASGSGGHAIHDEVAAALATQPALHFMGAGVAALNNGVALRTEIIIPTVYDGVVDSLDVNAAGKSNVYSTLQAAIAAGHKSILVRSAADAADIVISNDATSDAGTSTTITAFNMTDSGKVWDRDQWVGHIVTRGGVTATIIGNTPTIITHGGWSGATPANGAYTIASIPSSSGGADNVQRIVGSSTQAASIPVNLTSWKDDIAIENLSFSGKSLRCGGQRSTVFACLFTGDLNPGTVQLNGALTATATSIPYDTPANGGLENRGLARVDNEVVAYRTGGSNGAGTLLIAGANQRGQLETPRDAHLDNAVMTQMSVGHCIIDASDCQLVQCRFIGCSNDNVQALLIRRPGNRTRITSNVFLGNSCWSCVAIDPRQSTAGGNANGPLNLEFIGNTFDNNSTYSYIIECWNADDNNTASAIQGAIISGNLFKRMDAGCLRLFGQGWNIAGNLFFGGDLNTSGSAFQHNALAYQINQSTAGDSGSGGTVTYGATTLTDTGKAWVVNQWVGLVVTSGANTGTVLSNTATVITLVAAWAPGTPIAGAAYTIPATGVSAIATAITWDTPLGGVVGVQGPKGRIRIDDEIIGYTQFTGTQFLGLIRGLDSTTAAPHADNAAINNLSQCAIAPSSGLSALGGQNHLVSGNTFSHVSVICKPLLDTVGDYSQGVQPRMTWTTNVILYGSTADIMAFYSYTSYALLENIWPSSITIDLQNAADQIIFGGTLPLTAILTNLPSSAVVFAGAGTAGVGPTAVPSLVGLPTGRTLYLGRSAGDTSQVTVPLTNRTGATSVIGNIGIVDVANPTSFVQTAAGPTTLTVGVITRAVADGSVCQLTDGPGEVVVNCDTGAVAIGNKIVCSAITAGLGAGVAAPAVGTAIGTALTAKAGGANGPVTVLLRSY